MKPLALVLLLASVAHATTLPPGFTLETLSPVLPGISTTSNVVSRNPFDNTLWMSSGRDIYQLDGFGSVISSESLRGVDGGPLGIEFTSDLVFDSSGAMYVNARTFPAPSVIWKRAYGGGSWSSFASVMIPRAMEFDSSGNMIVLGGNGDGTQVGSAWSITPGGTVSTIGATQGESFVIEPATGDLLIPHYDGTGIDRLTQAGVLTTEFSWDRPIPILYEAIGLTAGGNYVIGVNLGQDEFDQNTSQLLLVNGITGERIVLGDNIVANQIPVDLRVEDRLLISNFGSLQGWEIVGNLDALLAIPEPGTGLLLVLGLAAMWWRRRR